MPDLGTLEEFLAGARVDPAVFAQSVQPNSRRFGVLYVAENTDAMNRLLRTRCRYRQSQRRRHSEREAAEHLR